MKLILVYPKWRHGLWSIFIYRMPPLGLYRLADLTPDDIDVTIIDENVSELTFPSGDLVGISCMTPAAYRAYEIADRYRSLGAKVVLGGIHPSTFPGEALRHADAVVVGEADDLWPAVLQDFKAGSLRPMYLANERPQLEKLRKTRQAPFEDKNKYAIQNFIQTARGCPVDCNFCSVTTFNGRGVRHHHIEHIDDEIKRRRGKSKYFLFADDNLVGNGKWAKDLFSLIEHKGYNIRWGSQVTIKFGMEEELVGRAAKSGCRVVFIGFESIDQHSLDFCSKGFKVRKYKDAINRIHDHGIFIIGSFIFGLDTDTPDVIKRTLDFAMEVNVEMCQFSILTPFPDTRLFSEFNNARRITSYDWSRYDAFHVVYQPRHMGAQDLQDQVNNAYKQYYAFSPSWTRFRRTYTSCGWKAALLGAKTSWDSYHFDI